MLQNELDVFMTAIDPICKMKVEEKSAKFKSDHDGKTFYFCSAGCKSKFDNDSHKYGH
ncbi:MAG: YHS domain-containing protein [Nitrososphaerales archaeon]